MLVDQGQKGRERGKREREEGKEERKGEEREGRRGKRGNGVKTGVWKVFGRGIKEEVKG